MGAPWRIVAFPLILPWRDEFWTLPLYFPDLRVGVTPNWPEQLPYEGMPLPPEAEVHPHEFQHYHPGDFRQWQAFEKYRQDQGEGDDMIQAIRSYGQAAAPEPPPSPKAWSLAWQLEKMQADQEAQLLLVDKGEDWLKDIFKAEPWEDRAGLGPAPGVEEMVDPELAQLRYRLWRHVLAPKLQDRSVPLLLGRTSRTLFLTLKGWPNWTVPRTLRLALPGCRSGAQWRTVCGDPGRPPWQPQFGELLDALLTTLADGREPQAALGELQKLAEDELVARWPWPDAWNWNLEIWAPDSAPDETAPVLCWSGAGAAIPPG